MSIHHACSCCVGRSLSVPRVRQVYVQSPHICSCCVGLSLSVPCVRQVYVQPSRLFLLCRTVTISPMGKTSVCPATTPVLAVWDCHYQSHGYDKCMSSHHARSCCVGPSLSVPWVRQVYVQPPRLFLLCGTVTISPMGKTSVCPAIAPVLAVWDCHYQSHG